MCGGASGQSKVSVAEMVELHFSTVLVILGPGFYVCGLCVAEGHGSGGLHDSWLMACCDELCLGDICVLSVGCCGILQPCSLELHDPSAHP